MKKKITITFILNIMAFASVMGTLYSELGFQIFIRLLIPLAIIFGTNLSATLIFLSTGEKTRDG